MTRYQKGYRIELMARDALKAEGLHVVRSAGSRGPVDLIAWDSTRFRLIQIKRGRCAKAEKEALADLDAPPNATVEVWIWRPRQGFEVEEIAKHSV